MPTSTPACVAYAGSLDSIADDASPGLLYLKAFLPSRDSLASSSTLNDFLAPNAVFINNANPPTAARTNQSANKEAQNVTTAKQTKRNAALQAIKHDFQRAWDIDNGDGRRTVIYESRNSYCFAADLDDPVLMPEAGIIELESIPEMSDENATDKPGVAGYWATELRSWHDRLGMLKKREDLGC
jgi:hypothetical protein